MKMKMTSPPPAAYYGKDYRPHQTLMFGYFEIGQTEKALLAMFGEIFFLMLLKRRSAFTKFSTLSGGEMCLKSVM